LHFDFFQGFHYFKVHIIQPQCHWAFLKSTETLPWPHNSALFVDHSSRPGALRRPSYSENFLAGLKEGGASIDMKVKTLELNFPRLAWSNLVTNTWEDFFMVNALVCYFWVFIFIATECWLSLKSGIQPQCHWAFFESTENLRWRHNSAWSVNQYSWLWSSRRPNIFWPAWMKGVRQSRSKGQPWRSTCPDWSFLTLHTGLKFQVFGSIQ